MNKNPKTPLGLLAAGALACESLVANIVTPDAVLSEPASPVIQGNTVSVSPPVKKPLELLFAADPHVENFDGRFWMYPTGQRDFNRRDPAFFAYSSTDLKTWNVHGPVLKFSDVKWIYDDGVRPHYAWAPVVIEHNGRYFFYFSVGLQGVTPSRIGVAVGDSPAGPFRDSGKPLLTGYVGYEAIDPMVFRDPRSGRTFFYAGGSAGRKLRVFEMAANLLVFKQEIPVETPPHYTEAPFVHFYNGLYYLSYSSGEWNKESYCVHYATSKTPVGPWRYRGLILQSDEARKGPGHHSFVRHPQSEKWFIVYHRWQHPDGGNPFRAGRSIAIEPIEYDDAGDILPITMSDHHLPVLQPNDAP
jgi:beta-xylosidase